MKNLIPFTATAALLLCGATTGLAQTSPSWEVKRVSAGTPLPKLRH